MLRPSLFSKTDCLMWYRLYWGSANDLWMSISPMLLSALLISLRAWWYATRPEILAHLIPRHSSRLLTLFFRYHIEQDGGIGSVIMATSESDGFEHRVHQICGSWNVLFFKSEYLWPKSCVPLWKSSAQKLLRAIRSANSPSSPRAPVYSLVSYSGESSDQNVAWM